jgi:hypothetical protein
MASIGNIPFLAWKASIQNKELEQWILREIEISFIGREIKSRAAIHSIS